MPIVRRRKTGIAKSASPEAQRADARKTGQVLAEADTVKMKNEVRTSGTVDETKGDKEIANNRIMRGDLTLNRIRKDNEEENKDDKDSDFQKRMKK